MREFANEAKGTVAPSIGISNKNTEPRFWSHEPRRRAIEIMSSITKVYNDKIYEEVAFFIKIDQY